MPATANEEILDLQVRHAVGLQRLSSSIVKKIIRVLNDADADIVAQLLKRDATLAGSFTSQRLTYLLNAIRDINRDAHIQVGQELRQELRDLAKYEVSFQQQMIGSALPVAMDIVAPSAQLLNAVVTTQPFNGKLLKDMVSELSATKLRRLRDAIRLGMVEGQTNEQIIQRVRGTQALGYKDGILQASRVSAERMVRTATNHVANAAREKLYEENADLIAGVQWVATLDTRTCPSCMALDGKVFGFGKGPRPPRHINCRCTTVPVTKSWKELGIDLEEAPPGTRASMNGQVPETKSFNDWLKGQSQEVQDQALGPSRAALFRTGQLDVDRFIDSKGNEVTLGQLKKLENDAFEKSGLNNPIKPLRGEPRDAIARFLADEAAQVTLLRRMVSEFERHLRVVQRVIEENGWDLREPPGVAIRHYTGSAYSKVNKRMRDGGPTLQDRKFTALTAKGVDQMPVYGEDIWRAPTRSAVTAQKLWDNSKIGQAYDPGNQLQSFSKEREIADSWAGEARLVLHIRAPSKGALIEDLSLSPGEREVLLPPGLSYKVVSKREEDAGGVLLRIIELEIVGG